MKEYHRLCCLWGFEDPKVIMEKSLFHNILQNSWELKERQFSVWNVSSKENWTKKKKQKWSSKIDVWELEFKRKKYVKKKIKENYVDKLSPGFLISNTYF